MTPRPRLAVRVGLDGFGTDLRPQPELEAARRAAEAGLELELIGDAAILEAALASDPPSSITLVHAPSQIAMDESPAKAVRPVKPEDIERMRRGAETYVQRGQRYKTALKRVG